MENDNRPPEALLSPCLSSFGDAKLRSSDQSPTDLRQSTTKAAKIKFSQETTTATFGWKRQVFS